MPQTKPLPARVVQPADPDLEVPAEVIATSITEIASAMKKLASSRLKRDAIVILIQAKTGLTKTEINAVINSLESLETTWLKPQP